MIVNVFFFSSRRRHTIFKCDWSSDVCSSDLSGIAAVRDAVEALEQGLNMTTYVEGKRSFDGKLLPFKKGPFYLAEECKVPVVPITISGTEKVMPKARFAIRPGMVTVEFHDPIEPSNFGERDCLMAKVRE